MGHGSRSEGAEDARLHVAMLPFLAFGHIVPFVHLSKKLAAYDGVRVSFLSAPANVPRISSLLSSASDCAAAAAVDVVPLVFPDVEGLPPGIQSTSEATPAMAELLMQAVDLMKPQVESFLADHRPHAIFHDFTYPWIPSVAHPLGVKTIFFSVFAAVASAFFVAPSRRRPSRPANEHSFPMVDDSWQSPPAGFPPPPLSTIDVFPAYQAAGFSYVFTIFYGMTCAYDRTVSCIRQSSAVVIKSCREMEAPYVDYLQAEYEKPMLLAGPLVPDPPTGELEQRWAGWLDGFPAGSVIFASFGSETFLTDEGILELALGLELTGLPFFLVLNFPKGGEEDAMNKLPEGFVERVRGRGTVHSGWVQQQHILAHPAVGCFLCHAGLSSLIEGVVNGCQLVLLPQKGDQFLNARLFAGDLRAAVEVPRRAHDGRFTREDVRVSVRKVTVEIVEEAGITVTENNRRWREFLLDGEVQRRFMAELVGKLRQMARSRQESMVCP